MPRPGSDAVILVTGFPSLYARKMIEHILAEEPSAFVYMTAEAKHLPAAQALLASMLSSQRDRVGLLEGSPTSIDLGLSGAEVRQISREIDRIHHMVHTSDETADKKAAFALNVVSTAEILEIARAATALQCLVLHSTASVSGEREGVVYEADLDEGQSFRSAVAETRMRAEALARRAMGDVPIAIVRPTTIIGGKVSVETPLAAQAPEAPKEAPQPASQPTSQQASQPAAQQASQPAAQQASQPAAQQASQAAPQQASPAAPQPALPASNAGKQASAAPPAAPPATSSNTASPSAKDQAAPAAAPDANAPAPAPPEETGPPIPAPAQDGRLEGIYLLVLLLIATPADLTIPLPGKTGDVPLHVVPLDYVVRAAHAIGRHPSAPGRTFHLADPSPPSARRLIELVTRSGRQRAARGRVPSDLAKILLRTPGIERFVKSPRAFVEKLMTPVRYDTRNTDAVLAGTGIECPPFDSYVEQLVAAVQEHIRSRRERRANLIEVEVDDPLS